MVYGGAILVLLLLQLVLLPVRASSGEIRQRSDGCGRNPLITLAAAFGNTYSQSFTRFYSCSTNVVRTCVCVSAQSVYPV